MFPLFFKVGSNFCYPRTSVLGQNCVDDFLLESKVVQGRRSFTCSPSVPRQGRRVMLSAKSQDIVEISAIIITNNNKIQR